jgi:hypothetical protein
MAKAQLFFILITDNNYLDFLIRIRKYKYISHLFWKIKNKLHYLSM